jgi:hypothetical protein
MYSLTGSTNLASPLLLPIFYPIKNQEKIEKIEKKIQTTRGYT